MLKSSVINLNLQPFDFIMGETETPHFYDFGIFGSVPEPPNQYYLSFETPGYLTKMKNNHWNMFETSYFYKSQNSGNPKCCHFGKRRAPKIPTILQDFDQFENRFP